MCKMAVTSASDWVLCNRPYGKKTMTHAKKILLLGADGQVGWELQRSLLPLGQIVPVDRAQCDLAQLDQVSSLLAQIKPELIVNAAAYTAVDQAEQEPEAARQLNSALPACLAEYARASGALLVDYSTDYVFDGGKSSPYLESDTPSAINVYGQSKQDGLQAIVDSGCRHLVLRVSWVYSKRGKNFLNTIMRLAGERDELSVVADQIGAPTPADLIADVTAHATRAILNGSARGGVYNLVPEGVTSWHGFAVEIVRLAHNAGYPLKLQPENIRPITTAEYPTPAHRPANSRLDTGKLKDTFHINLPNWRTPLQRFINQ